MSVIQLGIMVKLVERGDGTSSKSIKATVVGIHKVADDELVVTKTASGTVWSVYMSEFYWDAKWQGWVANTDM